MSDKELADAVIELGVGYYGGGMYTLHKNGIWLCPGWFLKEWDVAGALMEKMPCMSISSACKQSDGQFYHGWLKDPRAIIEKCVSALDRRDQDEDK